MAQISTLGGLPGVLPGSGGQISTQTLKSTTGAAAGRRSTAASDQSQVSPLQSQLVRLGGVLGSLQKGASAERSQFLNALNQVRSGSYRVEPLQISRSIVNDLLT